MKSCSIKLVYFRCYLKIRAIFNAERFLKGKCCVLRFDKFNSRKMLLWLSVCFLLEYFQSRDYETKHAAKYRNHTQSFPCTDITNLSPRATPNHCFIPNRWSVRFLYLAACETNIAAIRTCKKALLVALQNGHFQVLRCVQMPMLFRRTWLVNLKQNCNSQVRLGLRRALS